MTIQPQKLIISSLTTGLEDDKEPFLLDNTAFPTLENAFLWRKRLRRKPGTQLLGRLKLETTNEAVGVLTAGDFSIGGTLATLAGEPLQKGSLIVHVDATITDVTPGGTTLVTAVNSYAVNQEVFISGVLGITGINDTTHTITIANPADFTVSTSTGGVYDSGGIAEVRAKLTHTITGVTSAAPGVVTIDPAPFADHRIPDGTTINIDSVLGIDELSTGNSKIDQLSFVTANAAATTLQLAGSDFLVATTTSYISGGVINTVTDYETGTFTAQFPLAFTLDVDVLATYSFFPKRPVMGLKGFLDNSLATTEVNFPKLVAFDTVNAYEFNFSTASFFNASFYHMTPTGTDTQPPIEWSGQPFQQFWAINYENSMWVTNNNPGQHVIDITNITNNVAATQTVTTGVAHELIVGDFVFINEVTGATDEFLQGINATTFEVLTVPSPTTFTISLTLAVGGAAATDGKLFFLTRTHSTGSSGDGIRWYDGFGTGRGFVNFSPPLTNEVTPPYLVGGRIIIPFQNRLLVLGTFEKTSTGAIEYFKDRIRISEIGTPYYTEAVDPGIAGLFPGLSGGNDLVPLNWNTGAQAKGWMSNIGGRGDFIDLDTDERIISAAVVQNEVIIGLESSQRKLVGTANPADPYSVLTVNPELGTESTHAAIELDRGILSVGDNGYILSTSYSTQRFDEKIPNEIYAVDNSDNGNEKVSGIRDFFNELIYFNYLEFATTKNCLFPNRSLVYNYRDNNFAIFRENYTSQGYFRKQKVLTWADLTATGPYPTWGEWTATWKSSKNADRFPSIIGGTPQGFVMIKDVDNFPDPSRCISAISGDLITSTNHCVEQNDYILVANIVGGTFQRGPVPPVDVTVLQVIESTSGSTFRVDADFVGTYAGNGIFTALDNMDIQTRIFPPFWEKGLGTRIGAQRFLVDSTANGEATVNLFVSEDQSSTVNDQDNQPWLITNNILRTRPDESLFEPRLMATITDVTPGATTTVIAANTFIAGQTVEIIGVGGISNINDKDHTITDVTANDFIISTTTSGTYQSGGLAESTFIPQQSSEQRWHRMSTSARGDSVQIGFSFSDSQMRDLNIQRSDFTLHAIVIDLYPSKVIA